MPRTKTAAPQTDGSLALAQDMGGHVVDEATAEAMERTVNVFEKKKPPAASKPAARVTKATTKAAKTEKSPGEPKPTEAAPQSETVTQIPLTGLHPPEFCPFVVTDNENMARLVESIKKHGVREPGLARPRKDGGYELLTGGRRKRACELAEIPAMPVIIRELDDDSAAIAMVDSNLEQRDRLLPSEKAWAYRIKMEALNHKGTKGGKLSAETIAEQTGDSRNQIFRYIRLTELTITLLDKVDASQLSFNPAVELSYLSHVQQAAVASAMELNGTKPSLSQAKRLKKLKQEDTLSEDKINEILSESKPKTSHHDKISNRFRKYFPTGYTVKQMNDVIAGLLQTWQDGQAEGGANG